MAQQITRTLIDDLDGRTKTGVETVRYTFGGIDYTIDLSPRNREHFRNTLDKFITKSRIVSASTKRKHERNYDPIAVREWAKANNITVSDRGRFNYGLLAAYFAAQTGNTTKYPALASVPTLDPKFALESEGKNPRYSENVRAWALANGYTVSRFGVMPRAVVDAWKAAGYAAA